MCNILGLIVEYNPLHNGHIYHINTAKDIVKPEITIAIMSSHFTQRGEPAIIDKYTRTKAALKQGIDLVIELPFYYSTQSADYFSKGALFLLNKLKATHLVFGAETKQFESELSNIEKLMDQLDLFNVTLDERLNQGLSYPVATNKALLDFGFNMIKSPNDLLGFSYMKEIVKNNYKIIPLSISRTHHFHDNTLTKRYASASGIRNALKNSIDISSLTPLSNELYSSKLHYLEDYFPLLKYKLLTTSNKELSTIHLVNEGIENKMLKEIVNSTSMEEFITRVKSKRYTRTRVQRTIVSILMNLNDAIIEDIDNPTYIRVLGMNHKGRKYLHQTKDQIDIPIITRFAQIKDPLLDLEFRATSLYASILDEPDKSDFIKREYQKPVILFEEEKEKD